MSLRPAFEPAASGTADSPAVHEPRRKRPAPFADAPGPLRALLVGEEWGQLYVSNFHEVLTLYRQGGINFLGVFQNAGAQIESRYGRETARIWRKAVAHTLYRGLPDDETLRDIEHRSGKTSVMVRGFNVSASQVNGSGDNLVEQARPLLQVEDIRVATGGGMGLPRCAGLGLLHRGDAGVLAAARDGGAVTRRQDIPRQACVERTIGRQGASGMVAGSRAA